MVRHWRSEVGWTLLELLLVLVIVGILAGTVVTAFPNVGRQRQVQAEAERLALAIELARGEALRQNALWGLAVAEGGYVFHRYEGEGSWVQVSRRPLAPWATEAGISLSVAASPAWSGAETAAPAERRRPRRPGAEERGSQDAVPDIAIHPGGETTPFSVSVAGEDDTQAWVVRSDGFARAEALLAEQAARHRPLTVR